MGASVFWAGRLVERRRWDGVKRALAAMEAQVADLHALEYERENIAAFDPAACAAEILGPATQDELNRAYLELSPPANTRPL